MLVRGHFNDNVGLAVPTSYVDLVVCLPPLRNLEPIKEAGILEGRNGINETCLQNCTNTASLWISIKGPFGKVVVKTKVDCAAYLALKLGLGKHPLCIKRQSCSTPSAIVIGGGISGVAAAHTLHNAVFKELLPRLMSRFKTKND
ncbi:hypothetical protein Dimus_025842 [Dionaea muscipula]